MENKKDEFCCERMARHIHRFENKELNVYKRPRGSIFYKRYSRFYGLLDYPGNWDDITGCKIYYCPFCGKKLPKELDDDDMDPYLMKEYGWTEDDCWGYPRRELPDEFKTDEWWKKRGL